MKNKILFISSLLLFLLVVGCNNNKLNSNNTNTQPQSYSSPFSPNISPIQISITPTVRKKYEKTIARYSTRLLDSSSPRYKNIKLACESINKTIVNPGQIFSYNDDIGPVGPDSGFKKATTLDGHGKKTKDYGGGLCQISSTLYNAVKKTPLKVIERHDHSKAVGYVKKGNDAAVNQAGNKDFRFKNTLTTPVKIYASVRNKKVYITLKTIIEK